MIVRKGPEEIRTMQEGGRILQQVMHELAAAVGPGALPRDLDSLALREIRAAGAQPAQLGYRGYPATICVSRQEVVIHGIPGGPPLREGEVVSLDFAIIHGGYHVDMARSFAVGKVSDAARRLLRATEEAFWLGFSEARPGAHLGDVSATIGECIRRHGYHAVREFVGHGIGRGFHEDPEVANDGVRGGGPKLLPGMVFCIEPMVAMRAAPARVLADGWTASMGRGNLAAHYENTVAVLESGPISLTGGAPSGSHRETPGLVL